MSKLPWRLLARARKTARREARHTVRGLELLEDRCLLAGGTWAELGPSPQLNPTPNSGVSTGEATSGRVTSLAFGNYDGIRALYLGSASGGVWRSTTYTDASPIWEPVTDNIARDDQGRGAGLIDTGSIATFGDHVYVGTGEANFSPDSRYGGGILSSDDGANFTAAYGQNANEFLYRSVSKVLYSGS
jgi:hypothetical protein